MTIPRSRRQKQIVGPLSVILELQDELDVKAGYPKTGFTRNPGTGVFDVPAPPGVGVTIHLVEVVEHPTDPTLGALDYDPIAIPYINTVKAEIASRRTGGRATARDLRIDTLPRESDIDDVWGTRSSRVVR